MEANVDQSLDDRAAVFAALGEPVRLALVDRLATGDASPGELAADISLGSNLLAHHLRVLEDGEQQCVEVALEQFWSHWQHSCRAPLSDRSQYR